MIQSKTQESQAINEQHTSLVSSLTSCLSGPLAHTTGLCTSSWPSALDVPHSSHLSTKMQRSALLQSGKLSRFLRSSEDMWTATVCGAVFGIAGSSVWICLELRSMLVASQALVCLGIWSPFGVGAPIRKASSQSSVNVFRARQMLPVFERSCDREVWLTESCLNSSGLSKDCKVYASEQWIWTGRNKVASVSRGNVTSAFWPQSNFVKAKE